MATLFDPLAYQRGAQAAQEANWKDILNQMSADRSAEALRQSQTTFDLNLPVAQQQANLYGEALSTQSQDLAGNRAAAQFQTALIPKLQGLDPAEQAQRIADEVSGRIQTLAANPNDRRAQAEIKAYQDYISRTAAGYIQAGDFSSANRLRGVFPGAAGKSQLEQQQLAGAGMMEALSSGQPYFYNQFTGQVVALPDPRLNLEQRQIESAAIMRAMNNGERMYASPLTGRMTVLPILQGPTGTAPGAGMPASPGEGVDTGLGFPYANLGVGAGAGAPTPAAATPSMNADQLLARLTGQAAAATPGVAPAFTPAPMDLFEGVPGQNPALRGAFVSPANPAAGAQFQGNRIAQNALMTRAVQSFPALEKQYNLPPGLLNAVMMAESSGNPNAVSPKGASGLFQFMPATAGQYGVDVTNPLSSAQGAARYLSDLLKQTGNDLPSALASYNWGPGNVGRFGMGSLPTETQGYLNKVLSALPQGTPEQGGGPAAQWMTQNAMGAGDALRMGAANIPEDALRVAAQRYGTGAANVLLGPRPLATSPEGRREAANWDMQRLELTRRLNALQQSTMVPGRGR